MENTPELANFFLNKPKMFFPQDRSARTALAVYQPSYETEVLASETGRQIFSEALEIISTDESVQPLKELAFLCCVQNFKNGRIDGRIEKYAHVQFGELVDLEKPLLDVIELDNNTYWRRMCEKKAKDRPKFYRLLANPRTMWKKFGVETKLAEIIETKDPDTFDDDYFKLLLQQVSPFVESLDIRELKQCKVKTENLYDPTVKVKNVPIEWCLHVPLGNIIGGLQNLTELSLSFGVSLCGAEYKKYFFEISYDDIYSLSVGLKKLEKLQVLKMRHNKLDEMKLSTLMNALCKQHLKRLDLAYCHLDDICGHPIALLLAANKYVQEIELKGNKLGKVAMAAIGFALESYEGVLVYLGLSGNIVTDDGVLCIGGGVKGTKNIQILDLSSCQLSSVGVMRVTTFIGFHTPLRRVNCSNLTFDERTGDNLVKNLQLNRNIDAIDCRSSGLTEDQQHKVNILLKRNRYYKENSAKSYEFPNNPSKLKHFNMLSQRSTLGCRDIPITLDLPSQIEAAKKSGAKKLYQNKASFEISETSCERILGFSRKFYFKDYPVD